MTLLDPVRLLTLVPRNIGFSVAEAYDTVNDKLLAASKADKFIINFSQFYMLLLRVTQIVYADLFERDATLAFNKLLQVLSVRIAQSFVCYCTYCVSIVVLNGVVPYVNYKKMQHVYTFAHIHMHTFS